MLRFLVIINLTATGSYWMFQLLGLDVSASFISACLITGIVAFIWKGYWF